MNKFNYHYTPSDFYCEADESEQCHKQATVEVKHVDEEEREAYNGYYCNDHIPALTYEEVIVFGEAQALAA